MFDYDVVAEKKFLPLMNEWNAILHMIDIFVWSLTSQKIRTKISSHLKVNIGLFTDRIDSLIINSVELLTKINLLNKYWKMGANQFYIYLYQPLCHCCLYLSWDAKKWAFFLYRNERKMLLYHPYVTQLSTFSFAWLFYHLLIT